MPTFYSVAIAFCLFVCWFIARNGIYAIVRYMLSPVRHTGGSVSDIEVRTMQPLPQSSPMTLVSSRLTSPRNSVTIND